MKKIGELVLYAGVMTASVLMLAYTTKNVGGYAAIMPYVVFSTITVGVIIRIGSDFVTRRNGSAVVETEAETGLLEKLEAGDDEISLARAVRMVAWLIAFVATIYVLGFTIGTPILLFVFFSIESPLPPIKSAALAFLLSVGIVVVFDYILDLSLYSGMIRLY